MKTSAILNQALALASGGIRGTLSARELATEIVERVKANRERMGTALDSRGVSLAVELFGPMAAQFTQDSNEAFYLNQLEAFDPTLNLPYFDVTWSRDISLRPGITFAHAAASFTRSTFQALGTQDAQGKPWVDPNSNVLPGVSVSGQKVTKPIRALAFEITYNEIELIQSQALGMGVDMSKMEALQSLYQMWTDEQVYIGDAKQGYTGLVNAPNIGVVEAPHGLFETGTPGEILADINKMLTAAWKASGYKITPTDLRLDPLNYSSLLTRLVSETGGAESILMYIARNSLCNARNGRPLNIQPLKWLEGRGTDGKNRMMTYSNNPLMVRFPMVPIRGTQPYVHGINYNRPYIWAYGEVEMIRPETILYYDGI